jgi:hypothetical protein
VAGDARPTRGVAEPEWNSPETKTAGTLTSVAQGVKGEGIPRRNSRILEPYELMVVGIGQHGVRRRITRWAAGPKISGFHAAAERAAEVLNRRAR